MGSNYNFGAFEEERRFERARNGLAVSKIFEFRLTSEFQADMSGTLYLVAIEDGDGKGTVWWRGNRPNQASKDWGISRRYESFSEALLRCEFPSEHWPVWRGEWELVKSTERDRMSRLEAISDGRATLCRGSKVGLCTGPIPLD